MHTRLTKKQTNTKYCTKGSLVFDIITPQHMHCHRKNMQGCDSGKYAGRVFLDLKKAFHTVNHNILLKNLYHYGIRRVANNRTQFTSINWKQSDKRELKYGVP